MTEMKRKPILIPIDHGYGNVKTSNFIFPAGITEYKDEPAMAADTLCWAGRWYAIGDTHKEFIADKTADEDYLKLTMAAIAKELNKRGLTEAPVWLAVGLPLTWVGQQKDSFIRYLTQVRNLEFRFNGKDYAVEVVGVEMYAQGFAAVADRLKEFSGVNMLCDMDTEGCNPLGLQVRFADCIGRIHNSSDAPTNEHHVHQQWTAHQRTMLHGEVRHPSVYAESSGGADAFPALESG